MRNIASLQSRREFRLACDSLRPVRKTAELAGTGNTHYGAVERLAHPSISFPLHLNADWRVIDDPLQWILQHRKGNARGKNSGWDGRFYLRSRKGLLGHVREYCGEIDPGALQALSRLSEWHR